MEENNSDFKAKALAYFTKEIKQTEIVMIDNQHLNDIIFYSELETKLLEYITKLKTIDEMQKKQLRKELLHLLKKHYDLNTFNYDEHKKMQLNIELLSNIYITRELNCKEELGTFAQTGKAIKEQKEINNFCDYLRKLKESSLNLYIKDSMNLNYLIPQFLLMEKAKVIKNIIIITWRMNYSKQYDFRNKLEKSPEYAFLYKQYSDFFDGRIDLFDEKYLKKEENQLLFQALYYSNGEYLRCNANVTVFLNNFRRYSDLMHFDRKDQSFIISDCFDFVHKNTKEVVDNKFKVTLQQLDSAIGKVEEGKLNEKLLYAIFCLSCVLNGVIHAESDENIKAVFASALKCSAKEKIFLYNFLFHYDAYIQSKDNKTCLYYNHIMENAVLSALIKSYTKVLYDEQNKNKISFSYEKTMQLIEKSGGKAKKKQVDNDKDQDQQEEDEEETYVFNQLNDMEKEHFSLLFNKFREDIHEKEKDKETKKSTGLLSKLTNVSNLTSMIQLHRPMMKNKQTLLLLPINPLTISNHICICINGLFMNEEMALNDSTMWYNIISKEKPVDYYIYNWQTVDNISLGNGNMVSSMLSFVKNTAMMQNAEYNIIRDNKRMSKKFGRLLAYIIASRSVFKFHTISLLGFSLGCNVIKHCLKELYLINSNINVSDILLNVIFLGGATTFKDKHKNIFGLVSGTVYNFYSRVDHILNECYSSNAIGLKELEFPNVINANIETTDKEYQPHYINHDLTNDKFQQFRYGIELNKLLTKVNYY